jgi:tetratricopeptide (TPR) repeat protein
LWPNSKSHDESRDLGWNQNRFVAYGLSLQTPCGISKGFFVPSSSLNCRCPALYASAALKKYDWLFSLLIIAGTLLAYSPAWSGTRIWDDESHLTSPELQSIDGLVRIWTHPGTTPQYYPVTHTTFWIAYYIWGDATLGYHLLNIFLHAFSALVLLRILRRLEIPGAPLAAALFAFHPVQVESVAWMSELKNTLSGLFCLGAAYWYFRYSLNEQKGKTTYALSLILFVLAILSKAVVGMLPAALLVVLWWKRGRLSWRDDVAPLLPFFLLGSGFGIFSAWMERNVVGAVGREFQFSLVDRMLIAGRIIWFYLGKLVWPDPLIFNYPRWQIHHDVWWQYLFPLTLVGLLIVLWWHRKQHPAWLASFLLYCGTLFPALGFLDVYPFRYSFVADHFQYLACIAPLTLAAAGATRVFGKIQLLGAFAVVSILAVMSWQQAHMYSDILMLWRTTIDRNPDSWMAHTNLGVELDEQGRSDEAVAEYQTSLRLNPNDTMARNNLGRGQAQRGHLDEAIEDWEEVLRIDPDHAEAHNNLGNALAQMGRLQEAFNHWEKSLRVKPDFAGAHFNYAVALAQSGRFAEAVEHYEQVLRLTPDDADARRGLEAAQKQLQESR